MAGIAAPNSCVAAGPEVAEAIAEIMGVKIEAKEPDIIIAQVFQNKMPDSLGQFSDIVIGSQCLIKVSLKCSIPYTAVFFLLIIALFLQSE